MTLESATPPEQRRFDPRVGWWGCGFCPALFQYPLYDEEGNFYQDEPTAAGNYQSHATLCSTQSPYLNDSNAYYPNGTGDPEPKCYDQSNCFY